MKKKSVNKIFKNAENTKMLIVKFKKCCKKYCE